mmetsp:Transcript_12333/g.35488  ORF Transcript_12333/g.35488 Transcript_12333/m.35488 type:complete len:226 (+) Transcript_12333:924-1601(+)
MLQVPTFLLSRKTLPSAWNDNMNELVTPSAAQPHREPARCFWTSNVMTEPMIEPSGCTSTLTCVPAVIQSKSLRCSGSALSANSPTLLMATEPSLHNPATVCLGEVMNTTAKPSKRGLLLRSVKPAASNPVYQSLDRWVTMACSSYFVAKLSGVSQNATAPSLKVPLFSPLSVADIVNRTSKCLVSIAFLLHNKPYRFGTDGNSWTRSRSAMVAALANQSPSVSS